CVRNSRITSANRPMAAVTSRHSVWTRLSRSPQKLASIARAGRGMSVVRQHHELAEWRRNGGAVGCLQHGLAQERLDGIGAVQAVGVYAADHDVIRAGAGGPEGGFGRAHTLAGVQ